MAQGSCSVSATPPPPACNNNGVCEGGLGENSSNCADCVVSTPAPTPGPGGTPVPTPAPTPPPVEGACGSCSGCYAPDPDPGPSSCALLSGVCSKAGYCGSGAVSNDQCWIDGLNYPSSGNTCVVGSEGAFSSSSVRVPVGQTIRFCARVRGRGGEPAGFTVTPGTNYNATRYYYPNSVSPIFGNGGYSARFKGGKRPYFASVHGYAAGNGPFYMMVPEDWGTDGYPEDGNNQDCWRTMQAIIEAGTMDVYPNPLNVSVGAPGILYADVTPISGESVNQVTYVVDDVTVANAGSPGVGPNPYSSQIVGLTPGATTRVTVTAETTAGNIVRRPIINVVAAAQCSQPTPRDPPVITCSPGVGVDGSIVWRWAPVVDASEYNIVIEDSAGNPVPGIPGTGVWKPATDFGPTCLNVGSGECRLLTDLPPGTYHSAIQARGTCTASTVGRSTDRTVAICASGPWYQVTGGNVISGGNISSQIPLSCTLSPSCLDFLILNDPGSSRPGTVVYGGVSADFSGDPGSSGKASQDPPYGWQAKTTTAPNVYTYGYYENLASGKNIRNLPGGTVITTNLLASSPADGEYTWVRVQGDATINQSGGTINVNKKTVLFVERDLTISSRTRLNSPDPLDPNDLFFMVIVGRNINIDPVVVSADLTDPALRGVYHSDGTFSTGSNGTDDGLLVIEGSVAAAAIDFERDLVDENIDSPAETVLYSPLMVVNYPSSLSQKHLIWREVAP